MKKAALIFILICILLLGLCACGSAPSKNVYISEVMSKNVSTIADENGDMCDWIELHNPTGEPVNLKGYTLSDAVGSSDSFTFPDFTLSADEYLVVFANGVAKVDSNAKIVHVPFSISSKTDSVMLFNDRGRQISVMNVSSLGQDQSLGVDENGKLKVYDVATPGKPNYEGASVSQNTGAAAETGGLIINEYSTTSANTLQDETGEFVSWCEIYNPGEEEISLLGCYLSDDALDLKKWEFPAVSVGAGEYLVVYLSGQTKPYDGKYLHCSFKLSGNEDELFLVGSRGEVLDSCKVYKLISNITCGRDDDDSSKFLFFPKATPGAANNLKGFDSVDSARRTGNKAISITEVAAVNTTAPQSSVPEYFDYVELRNNTKKTINLNEYRLSDSKKSESFKTLPDRQLEPGEYVAIFCGEEDRVSSVTGNIYVSFGLNRYGETVYVLDKSGVVVDSFTYGRLKSGYSSGRVVPDGDEAVYFSKLTPGEENPKTTLSPALADPSFSLSSSFVEKGAVVEITAPAGEIRYTTDGSEPTEKSLLYAQPITISENTALRAKAFSQGYVPSDTTTATYIVGKGHTLPVIFLTTDPDNLYDYNTGIWADGPGKSSEFPYVGANYWQDWERPVNFEYLSEDGVAQVGFDAGIKVFGQFSRAISQKSVSINLRDKYGPTEICYPFFKDNDVNVFSSFVLRNSGQDFTKSHIRDAFCAMVIKNQVDVDFMDYQPVVAYVNGEYHGIYDMREKIDEDYIANHSGADPDNIDLIKGNNIVQQGTMDEYNALLEYIRTHNMALKENYDYVCERIDIDELISYWMCESFFTNTDTGNIRFYRERTDGAKWRWIFFDVDWALYPSTYKWNYINNYLNPDGHGVGRAFRTTIMVGLIKNSSFRKRLLEIHSKHLKTTFDTERMLKLYDEMIEQIRPEMSAHCERWEEANYEKWERSVSELRQIISEKKDIFVEHMIDTFNMTSAEVEKYLK